MIIAVFALPLLSFPVLPASPALIPFNCRIPDALSAADTRSCRVSVSTIVVVYDIVAMQTCHNIYDAINLHIRCILFSQPISLAERTRSIDHYRRFKAISFLVVKTILDYLFGDMSMIEHRISFYFFFRSRLTCTCIKTDIKINQVKFPS